MHNIAPEAGVYSFAVDLLYPEGPMPLGSLQVEIKNLFESGGRLENMVIAKIAATWTRLPQGISFADAKGVVFHGEITSWSQKDGLTTVVLDGSRLNGRDTIP